MQQADPLSSHLPANQRPVEPPEKSEVVTTEGDQAGDRESSGPKKNDAATTVVRDTKEEEEKGTGKRA